MTAIFKRPKHEEKIELVEVSDSGKIYDLHVDSIRPNPSQPRTCFDDDSLIKLADSIRIYGILQPITVRRVDSRGEYELVAGERRLRAAKLLGLERMPCIVIDVDSRRSAELAIIENLQRENLNIFEQASSIASLIDIYDLTQEEAARQLSVSQSFIANKLRILRLTAHEREMILEANLTERHARALLKIEDISLREKAISTIIKRTMNVQAAENYIESLIAPTEKAREPRKVVLKDIRIFYNSVEKAIALVRAAGIAISAAKSEEGEEEVYTIRIRR